MIYLGVVVLRVFTLIGCVNELVDFVDRFVHRVSFIAENVFIQYMKDIYGCDPISSRLFLNYLLICPRAIALSLGHRYSHHFVGYLPSQEVFVHSWLLFSDWFIKVKLTNYLLYFITLEGLKTKLRSWNWSNVIDCFYYSVTIIFRE